MPARTASKRFQSVNRRRPVSAARADPHARLKVVTDCIEAITGMSVYSGYSAAAMMVGVDCAEKLIELAARAAKENHNGKNGHNGHAKGHAAGPQIVKEARR